MHAAENLGTGGMSFPNDDWSREQNTAKFGNGAFFDPGQPPTPDNFKRLVAESQDLEPTDVHVVRIRQYIIGEVTAAPVAYY